MPQPFCLYFVFEVESANFAQFGLKLATLLHLFPE
jgi:hypothetical protein